MNIDQDILHEINRGRKVRAIKLLRDRENIGLNEAKKIVDQQARARRSQSTAVVKVAHNKWGAAILSIVGISALVYFSFKNHPNFFAFEPIVVIYALLGFWSLAFEKAFIVPARSERTQGRIVGYTQRRASSSRPLRYAPDVEFLVNDTHHIATSPSYSKIKRYAIGDRIDIQYDPVNPDHIETNKHAVLVYILFMLIPPVIIFISFQEYGHMPVGWFVALTINALMIPGIIDRHNAAESGGTRSLR